KTPARISRRIAASFGDGTHDLRLREHLRARHLGLAGRDQGEMRGVGREAGEAVYTSSALRQPDVDDVRNRAHFDPASSFAKAGFGISPSGSGTPCSLT